MTSSNYNDLTTLYSDIAVTENQKKMAFDRFEGLKNWLTRTHESNTLKPFSPDVYMQGSFAIGTAIKPITDDELDIDSVCQISCGTDNNTQKAIKNAVGVEVRSFNQSRRINQAPKEGRRCWTINYADDAHFHMDVLPAVPATGDMKRLLENKGHYQDAIEEHAIAITDKKHPDFKKCPGEWPLSNPRGYQRWFFSRMSLEFDRQKQLLKEARGVDQIPDYAVVTPLQGTIQLLKRHRDVMFKDDTESVSPISIIITTLAAKAYSNQRSLEDAIAHIIHSLADGIEDRGGQKWVPNPVNPAENFADKWSEGALGKRKEQAFYDWHSKLRRDFTEYFQSPQNRNMLLAEALQSSKAIVPTVTHQVLAPKQNQPKVEPLKHVVHKKVAPWLNKPLRYPHLSLHCYLVDANTGQLTPFDPFTTILPKNAELRFTSQTFHNGSHTFRWQVTNNGPEALSIGQGRGDFINVYSGSTKTLSHTETTAYSGIHSVQCFLTSGNDLLAFSDEVPIRVA